MEVLVQLQHERAAQLVDAIEKFNQAGSAITRQQLDKHQQTVTALFTQYHATDKELIAREELGPNHPYTTERRQIRQAYEAFMEECQGYRAPTPTSLPKKEDKRGKTPSVGSIPDALKTQEESTNTKAAETSTAQGSSRGNVEPPKPTTSSSVIVNKVHEASLYEQEVTMTLLWDQLDQVEQDWESGMCDSIYAKIKIDDLKEEIFTIKKQHRALLINIKEDQRISSYFKENHYGTLIQNAEATIRKLHRVLVEVVAAPQPVSRSPRLRLPEIPLPTFSGEYETWRTFYDTFTKLIHEDQQLCNTEKMHYLKSHLRKSAAQLISNLSPIGENYEKAWDLLKERYDNKRLLAASFFNAILELSPIQRASATNIRTFHDITKEMLHNVQNLQLENPFDSLITHLLMKKLDHDTREQYESQLADPREVPRLEDCLNFLLRRFQSLETSESYKSSNIRTLKPEVNTPRKVFVSTENHESREMASRFTAIKQPRVATPVPGVAQICHYCNGHGHLITHCIHFSQITPKARSCFINRHKLCTNCLTHGSRTECNEKPSCTKCSDKHHSLLHDPPQRPEKRVSISTADTHHTTLLATAMVRSTSIEGTSVNLRALIDPGSQVSLITEKAAQQLGVPLHLTTVKIAGVGATKPNTASARVQICLQPYFPSSYQLKIEAYVLPRITMEVPEITIQRKTPPKKWSHLPLADPNFNTPAAIDILLGADVYCDFIGNHIIKGKPSAIETSFGWIISGPTQIETNHAVVQSHSGTKIEETMSRFWELEEVPGITTVGSHDDATCESIFQNTTRRNPDGRYVVQLPFKEPQGDQLGCSRQRALQRYLQLERKLDSNKELRELYTKFMTEYQAMGHMKLVVPFTGKYYLPHHAVTKKTPESTKVRVVFDASMKTSTGSSLNDTMHTGPSLQTDLWAILLKWRKYRVVFSADIEKMYRQIKIHEEHHPYQTIFWREKKHHPLQEYQLTTVTYGTSAAPYLAIRTLHQLANDEMSTHPEACNIVKNNFYVDDVLTGADTIEDIRYIQAQLTQLLHKGGMELGKWASNHPDILKEIPEQKRLIGKLNFTDDESIKTLGVQYNPSGDYFIFHVDLPPNTNKLTKRQFLSEMSRIFDPLGWLTPLTVSCKIMYQGLWTLNLAWDDPLPPGIAEKWDRLKTELRAAQLLQIPRYIQYTKNNCTFELLGFCDASENAYAAVVYSKTITHGQVEVRLLTARSKVAPTKTKLTIPRLELCGALLLSRLVKRVIKVLEVDISKITLWSDSTITLAWIRKPPSTWKAFVANRVAEIQANSDINSWYHIRSEDNPADCASRGTTAKQLASMGIWWDGPAFLSNIDQTQETGATRDCETTEEMRSATLSHLQTKMADSPIQTLINKHSSFNRVIHITTYLLRWRSKHRGAINSQEWNQAVSVLVRTVQRLEFQDEYQDLEKLKSVHRNSKLQSLHPFLDEQHVIRVGGRLRNTQLSYEEQHPMILPYKGQLTQLILDWGHHKTLHGGNALTLAFIRKRFWIIKGVQAVKHHNHQCTRCHRFKVSTTKQLMGDLPSPRVTTSRPFTHTGVDYAGPFDIRMSKGRGTKSYKGYICVFICLATKAVHIEVASDLSTEGFLSAFRRFIGRRGNVAHMYSDNGTNFVGANKALQPINWHFIPPTSPHFGGLWEAGVKSIKSHLKKCIGDTKLTFEEITTLLVQIEACLNSRPLCPLTEDPESLEVLTPAHFLIGDTLISPPGQEHLEVKTPLLSRWRVVQNIRTQFWQKWMTDYLHRLQQRPKWQQETTNLIPGNIVLLRDELQPPTRWKLGRVTEIHPGNDGLTRVVTLKTADSPKVKRPITKLSPLPFQNPILGKDETEQITTSPSARQQPSRKAKQTRGSTSTSTRLLLHTCILLCIGGLAHSYPGSTQESPAPVTISSWNNSGMYFDKIARVELISTRWKLVIRYNLSSYWHEMHNVDRGLEMLEQACNNVKPVSCNVILQQLLWQVNNIKQDNEFLMQNNFNSRRLRRGVGDSVGLILGDMFGILSQREAEQYENQFEQLQLNEEYTMKLLKNQTSILDNTLKLFKHSNNITTQHLQQLMEVQHQFDRELAQLSEYRTHQDKALGVILLSLQLGLTIKHLEDTQRGLLDVITGAQNHIIHPSVLSPQQLEQEVLSILKHVPKATIIPGHGQLELQHLYRLMSIKTRVTNENAIIVIDLPLVQAWNYQLYEVLSTPLFINNTQIKIQPSTPYIMIDQYRERFAPVSLNERANCKEIAIDLILCDIPTLYTRQTKVTQCEISMFLHLPVQHESCPLHVKPPEHYFIKLQAPNQWIFGTNQTLVVETMCDSIISQKVTLDNYGILTLTPGCTLRSNDLHLSAVSAKTTNRDESFVPAFSISVYSFESSTRTLAHSRSIFTTPDTSELESDLKSLQIDETRTITPHHIHHYVVSHLILWALVCSGIIVLLRRCYRANRPRPAAREAEV